MASSNIVTWITADKSVKRKSPFADVPGRIEATLQFIRDSKSFPSFELRYGDGVVNGEIVRYNPKCPTGCRQSVGSSISFDTVDQRIDWAAVLAGAMAPGDSVYFVVYDPPSGLSDVTGHVVGAETVRTPAGSFEAMRIVYQMRKATGIETYYVLASQSGPRVMLREEFPNGVITELTGMVINHLPATC